MPLDWTPFVNLVDRHRRFLLTTHVRPDPDGLGSMLGLGEALEARGKSVRMLIASTFPPAYEFLDPGKRIEVFDPPGDAWRATDAVVVLDTGTWNQLDAFGPFLQSLSAPRVVIDHHPTQDDLSALRLVDTAAEATGRLVRDAIRALGVPLTPSMAQALFAALATDTGWFRHESSTPETHRLAAELQEAGARPTELYDRLFEQNNLPRLKLSGLVLERIQLACGGRISYSEVCRDDYDATGAVPQDTENLVNYPRSVAGIDVALLFMEQPRGGVKVSFRSRTGLDVGRIAERFGGGGHRLASGARLEVSLEEARARVLDVVCSALAAR